MSNCNRINKIKGNLKLFLLKLRYPKAGKYTLAMLSWGYKLKDFDEWIDDYSYGLESKNIWDQREEIAEIDSQYWESE